MIAIALLLLSLTSISSALILHLPAGRVKCLTDDLRPGTVSVGRYHISHDDLRPGTVSVGRYHISHDDHHLHSHNVSARVSDPKGETVHRADGVEEGEFAFVAAAEGRHTACFWSSRFERDAALELEFEWRSGVAAKGWTAVVKKDKIDVMGLELKRLEDAVGSIHEEMLFLRQREEEARKINEITNSWMGAFSLMSLVICLGVAGLQLWYLKNFFERRKIL